MSASENRSLIPDKAGRRPFQTCAKSRRIETKIPRQLPIDPGPVEIKFVHLLCGIEVNLVQFTARPGGAYIQGHRTKPMEDVMQTLATKLTMSASIAALICATPVSIDLLRPGAAGSRAPPASRWRWTPPRPNPPVPATTPGTGRRPAERQRRQGGRHSRPSSKATTAEATTSRATTSGPTISRATTSEPTTSRPMTFEPMTSGPTISRPMTSEPTTRG